MRDITSTSLLNLATQRAATDSHLTTMRAAANLHRLGSAILQPCDTKLGDWFPAENSRSFTLITYGILPFCSGGNQPQRTIRGPTRKAQRESTICSQIHQPLKATKAINKESTPKAPILNQHDSTRREPCQPLFSKGWLKANGTHVKIDMPHQPDADKRCPPPRFQGWVGGKNSESWVQSQPKVA